MSVVKLFAQYRKLARPRMLALVALLPIALLACLPVSVLELRDTDQGRRLFMTRVSEGDAFELRYIHSVEHVPVRGIFRIEDRGQIAVAESIFSSYGAGLPFDTAREDIIFQEDQMRIIHREAVIDRLRIFVSPSTNQQFIYSGAEVDLSQVEEGHIVELKVRRFPLVLFWVWSICNL